MTVSNNLFENNTAVESGGAIYYDLYNPILDSNTFTNNSAPYGPNMGSYATKIMILNESYDGLYFTNVGSGVQYFESFGLAMFDNEDQIMALDNASQIVITANDSSSSISGINAIQVDSGQVVFDDITFVSHPGSTRVPFTVTSATIDLEKLKLRYGSNHTLEKLYIDFRWCEPGEIQTNLNE